MPRPAKFSDSGILDAAAAIVAAEGPAAATMTAIGAALGAPNASLYHRFGSRDELLGRLWLRKAGFFQDNFASALSHPDPVEAGLRAALSLPDSVRRDFEGARILLLHRREDFLGAGWPREMKDEALRLGLQVKRALDQASKRLFGGTQASARRKAAFAILDVPFAAVRRYVSANEMPPKEVDDLIAIAYGAIVARTARKGSA